jgi:hypothetical protein
MWAPEMDAHRYIVGYEVYLDGHAFWWGHLAVHLQDADPMLLQPQLLLDHLCATAAQRHDVASAQVRLKMISRL